MAAESLSSWIGLGARERRAGFGGLATPSLRRACTGTLIDEELLRTAQGLHKSFGVFEWAKLIVLATGLARSSGRAFRARRAKPPLRRGRRAWNATPCVFPLVAIAIAGRRPSQPWDWGARRGIRRGDFPAQTEKALPITGRLAIKIGLSGSHCDYRGRDRGIRAMTCAFGAYV
jgi:hypothetical protein